METIRQTRCEARARIFKALGHPARMFIVEELTKSGQCVCKLTEMLELDISTVSKHLSVLKAAGVVRDEKRGQQVFYTLRMPCVANLFGCIDQVVRQKAQEQVCLLD
mgnify:CR=1 FL=1